MSFQYVLYNVLCVYKHHSPFKAEGFMDSLTEGIVLPNLPWAEEWLHNWRRKNPTGEERGSHRFDNFGKTSAKIRLAHFPFSYDALCMSLGRKASDNQTGWMMRAQQDCRSAGQYESEGTGPASPLRLADVLADSGWLSG